VRCRTDGDEGSAKDSEGVPHPSIEERRARGKEARADAVVQPQRLGGGQQPDRPDPVGLLAGREAYQSDEAADMSFRLSFHLALLSPTGAHWLDDPSDVSCKDGMWEYAVDGSRRSCK
jgi:hypothetical protein